MGKQLDQERFAQNGLLTTSTSKQPLLQHGCIEECHILRIRCEEQSHVLKQKTDEFSLLRISYERDMEEVKMLTEVLTTSMSSLEFQLAASQHRLQLLLHSEVLEEISLIVTGSKHSNRSDLIHAFWNEKPETRLQLLDWFSDSIKN